MTDGNQVRAAMIEGLGITFGMTVGEVTDGLSTLGSDYLYELDSKTAEFLLVSAEHVVGRRLCCPADLRQDQYATLGDLIDVVVKEI